MMVVSGGNIAKSVKWILERSDVSDGSALDQKCLFCMELKSLLSTFVIEP